MHTDGDMSECGQDGKPGIHLNVQKITYWIEHIIEEYAPPKTCFKLETDPAVTDSLGNEIKLWKNDDEVGTALGANELLNEICIEDTLEEDVFEFRNGGKDNVSLFSSGLRVVRKSSWKDYKVEKLYVGKKFLFLTIFHV